jgi:hypothetical protein
MKSQLLLILILSFSWSVFGQSSQAGRFTPKSDKFSVIIPGTDIINMSDPLNKSGVRAFITIADDTYFHIFSEPADNREQSQRIYEFIKSGKASSTKSDLDKLKIEQYNFSDTVGYYYKIVFVKTPKRTYAFQTSSTVSTNPSIERFFSSIEIEGQNPNLKIVSAMSNLSGSSQPDEVASSPLPIVSPQAIPLQITLKPRGNYTDFARFYRVSGVVRLKVIFQADGTIGKIVPIVRLPFGLTEQAIKSARGIKFQPSTLNGAPIDVTKFVEYNFTLY